MSLSVKSMDSWDCEEKYRQLKCFGGGSVRYNQISGNIPQLRRDSQSRQSYDLKEIR